MKNAIVTFVIVAFLTSFPGLPVQAQYYEEGAATIDVSQYYGGVETTDFGVYDSEAGVWVQVPVRRLPWWWTPPPDWVIWSTLGIATAAVVMSAVFIGGGLNFGSVFFNDYRYRGRLGHFHHFRDSVVGPRFRTHYGSARRDAERRHPEGLRHSPGTRGPGAGAVRGPGGGTRGPAGSGAVRGPNTGTRGPAGSGSGAVRGPSGGGRGPGHGAVHGPAPNRGGGGKPQTQPQQQKRGR